MNSQLVWVNNLPGSLLTNSYGSVVGGGDLTGKRGCGEADGNDGEVIGEGGNSNKSGDGVGDGVNISSTINGREVAEIIKRLQS